MTTIAVAGVKGAGGVTTTALALAASNAVGGATMLVEADPSGGSLLAWCEHLRGAGDLYDVAGTRNGTPLTAVAEPLGDLTVVTSRGSPFRLTQALERPRTPWSSVFAVDATVFIDVGRMLPQSPALGIVAAADLVVLVSAAEPGPVAATIEWANRGGRHGADDGGVTGDRLRLVTTEVVGHRRTVSPSDLSAVSSARHVGHLPHDTRALNDLCLGGSVVHKRLRRRPLVEAAHAVNARLAVPTAASDVQVTNGRSVRGGLRRRSSVVATSSSDQDPQRSVAEHRILGGGA